MVDQVIKLKRNTANTNAPDTGDIVVGELAIGAVAGKLYLRKSDDSILTFSDDSNVSTTLTIAADSGSNDTVTVGTNTLTFNGTSNQIGTTVSDNAITIALSDDPVIGGTGSIRVPDGTTGQRPGSPAAGMFRYNTTTSKFEGYTDDWGDIGGGGANTFTRNAYTGDGSTTAFTLSQTVNSENDLIVFIEGVFQDQDAYSVSGTTLTFDTAPVNGRGIIVYSVKHTVAGSNLNIDTMTGDGSDTTLSLTISPNDENNTQVFIDGVYQNKSTYSISGSTLTFSTAPPNGSAVECMTFTQTDVNEATYVTANANNSTNETVYPVFVDGATGKQEIETDTGLTYNPSTGNLTIGGALTAATLDISGDIDIDGTLEADAITVNGTTLAETISDTVGAMVSSNTETGIAVTYDDSDNTLDFVLAAAQSTVTSLGTLTALTVDDITIDGSTISDGGDFKIDADGDIRLDANGADLIFQDNGTDIGTFTNSSSDFVIASNVQDKDIIFKGDDNGSAITALTLDMSAAGAATFNSTISLSNNTAALFSNAAGSASLGIKADTSDRLTFRAGGAWDKLLIDGSGNVTTGNNLTTGGNLEVGGADVTITANIIHSGDTNTYFGFNDVDTWRVVTGGSEALRVDSSQRIGIGTTAPQGNLHIEGAAGASGGGILYITDADNGSTSGDALHISKSGDTAFVYNRESSGDLQLGAGNTSSHVVIKSDGDVGIGTTSPAYALHVENSGSIAGLFSRSGSGTNSFENAMIIDAKTSNDAADGFGPALYFTFTDSGVTRSEIANISVIRDGADNSGQMQFGVRNAGTWDYDALVIDKTSNLGIGTAAPNECGFQSGSRVLTIAGQAADDFGVIELLSPDTTSSNRIGEIRFGNMDDTDTPVGMASVRSRRDGADDAADLSFWTEATSASMSEKMTITSGGNVGIGITTPNESGFGATSNVLSIAGTAQDAFGVLELISTDVTSSNRIGEIRFGNLDAGSSFASNAGIRATRDGADNSSALSLWTTNAGTFAEVMHLSANKDVGIGVSPVTNSRLTVKSQGDGTYPIRVVNSADTDMLFGVYESSDGDGNNGMLYLNDGAGNTDVKISTNGDSYFNGGKVAIGADHADEPLTVRSSAENINTCLIEVGNDLHATNTKDAWIKFVAGAATNDYSWAIGAYPTDFRFSYLGARGTAVATAANVRMQISSGGRQTYNDSSTANGHANFVGEVGSNSKAISFEHTNGGGEVGTIVTGSSSTTYNTSSDYRLKENVDYDWDATTRLKQLKPARFNWIADDTNTLLEGFLAHEVSTVVPNAVTGGKDAMADPILYEDGDELPSGKKVGDVKKESAPAYQGIDHSKLVPLLVKTIQELEARIKTLEAA